MRSGVKTQRSNDGVDLESPSMSGWTLNLRIPWFSIRNRRRADIHFCVLNATGEAEPAILMPMHHFHIRQPSASSSLIPKVLLHCSHPKKLT